MFARKRKKRRHFICEICQGRKYQQSKEKMSQQQSQYIQARDKPMRGFVMQKFPKPDPYPRKELTVQRNCVSIIITLFYLIIHSEDYYNILPHYFIAATSTPS